MTRLTVKHSNSRIPGEWRDGNHGRSHFYQAGNHVADVYQLHGLSKRWVCEFKGGGVYFRNSIEEAKELAERG